MIRVLHVVSGDLWAGAEVMVYNLLKNLQKQSQFEVYTFLLNEGRLSRELRNLGLKVFVVEENRHSFQNIGYKLYKLIRTVKPHVVHSHRYKENVLSFLTTRLSKGTKLVTTQHGLPEIFSDAKKQRFVTRLNYSIMKMAFDKVVCVSNEIKGRFIDWNRFDPALLAVVHNGISLNPPKNDAKMGSGDFCIGSAGRLFPVKDYKLFIEIAHGVMKINNNVRFLLAGEGPEMSSLEMIVGQYGLGDRFEFLGHLDNMSDLYNRLNLYLNTSIHEGVPMSVLEAMAHGIPVVAPAVGGLREIIEHGQNGYLIDSRVPEDYADVCLDIMGDEHLHQRLSAAARQRVSDFFTADQMAKNYCKLYRELIAN